MIVFVLVGLWVGRGHLQNVYRKAFHSDEAIDDSGEMLSYRQALLGLILGEIVAAGGWLVLDYITGHMGSFLTQI